MVPANGIAGLDILNGENPFDHVIEGVFSIQKCAIIEINSNLQYAECSSVDDMKEKNKVEFYSRDEAINQGYEPCKRCNP